MTSKTRLELVYHALASLGVLAAGQTPSDEDVSAVDDHVDETLSTLSAKDIANVTDDDEIPVEWFGQIAAILTENAALEFGRPANLQAIVLAENELRVINRGRPTGEPLVAEYF